MKNIILLAGFAIATSASAQGKGAADQDFVTKAGQAGIAEVRLGKVASDQGASAAVKQFGQQMVQDHGKANDELAALAAKAGATVPTEPSAAQTAVADQLKQKRGTEFDNAYAKAMVKDHQEAVALFKGEASSGQDAQLKAFAQQTLPTLQSHLQMAKKLEATK